MLLPWRLTFLPVLFIHAVHTGHFLSELVHVPCLFNKFWRPADSTIASTDIAAAANLAYLVEETVWLSCPKHSTRITDSCSLEIGLQTRVSTLTSADTMCACPLAGEPVSAYVRSVALNRFLNWWPVIFDYKIQFHRFTEADCIPCILSHYTSLRNRKQLTVLRIPLRCLFYFRFH